MSTTLEQLQYGFDRDSRRTWQRRLLTDAHDQQYNYDALGQVSAAARGSLNLNKTAISGVPAAAESWDYDPTGNWRGYHTAAAGTTTLDQHRVHDRGNRMTQIEDNPNNMILDRVGRMRQMAPDAAGDWDGKLEITWDAWSRITSVKNNGEVVGEYSYDGKHRRITREVDGDTLHSYFNNQWRPLEERKDAETTASVSYLWGARHRDDLVRRDRAVSGTTLNETRYVLMDYFNPATITDASGVVKERYAFSAFGLRTILNPDFTVRGGSECTMEFGFQGQFLDTESGLMNYGYRYYSPHLGRWTCKDPIGERGGLNLLALDGNTPVNNVDHLGLIGPAVFILIVPLVLSGCSRKQSRPTRLCGSFKVSTVEVTGTGEAFNAVYAGSAYKVQYTDATCCKDGSIRLVQAIEGNAKCHMDATAEQSKLHGKTPGGIPIPEYAGGNQGEGVVIDAPGGDGGPFGSVTTNAEICAICTCNGKETNLGCLTLTWNTGRKTPEKVSGPDPKEPGGLFNNAEDKWRNAGGKGW